MFGLLHQRQSDMMCSFPGGQCPLQVKQHNSPTPPSIYSSVFNLIWEKPSSLNYPFFFFFSCSFLLLFLRDRRALPHMLTDTVLTEYVFASNPFLSIPSSCLSPGRKRGQKSKCRRETEVKRSFLVSTKSLCP